VDEFGLFMHRVISLFLILSLVFVPAQHLLAGQFSTMGDHAMMDSAGSHQASQVSLHFSENLSDNQSGDLKKNMSKCCEDTCNCSHCPSISFDFTRHNTLNHSERYSSFHEIFLNTSLSPKLPPPRNA
jgi:hypothetical protein